MDTFGERLKFVRGRQSQAAFAALFGIPQVTLGNYERNRNEPRFELIRRICIHFGINVEWLLFGTGAMRSGQPASGADTAVPDARLAALEEERRGLDAERRGLSEENRRLHREKADLLERNAELRERVARLEGELRQPGTVRPAAGGSAVA